MLCIWWQDSTSMSRRSGTKLPLIFAGRPVTVPHMVLVESDKKASNSFHGRALFRIIHSWQKEIFACARKNT